MSTIGLGRLAGNGPFHAVAVRKAGEMLSTMLPNSPLVCGYVMGAGLKENISPSDASLAPVVATITSQLDGCYAPMGGERAVGKALERSITEGGGRGSRSTATSKSAVGSRRLDRKARTVIVSLPFPAALACVSRAERRFAAKASHRRLETRALTPTRIDTDASSQRKVY